MKTTEIKFDSTTETGRVFTYRTAQNYFSVTINDDGTLEEVYDVYMGTEPSKEMQRKVFKAVKESDSNF